MASSTNADSVEELIAETLQNVTIKEFGGEPKTLKELSSPEKFLNWQFPSWKYNNETIMIPSVFTPSQLGLTVSRDGQYRHQDEVNIIGITGEELVYRRLQEIGQANKLGMFVIHDFKLEHIKKWNEGCKGERPEDQVPKPLTSDGQSDFIVFQHKKRVILVEVKNIRETTAEVAQKCPKPSQRPLKGLAERKEASSSTEKGESSLENATKTETSKATPHVIGSKNLDEEIKDARKKPLERCKETVVAFAKSFSDSEQESDIDPFPVRMVIALPSTKKCTAHERPEDTLFIYKEDLESPESFCCWWNDHIETAPSMATTVENNKAYELALSRVLAVRHLGPVSENEYTAITSHTLKNFKHLGNLAEHYWTIRETEYPHLFRWCQDMFQVTKPYSELPGEKFLKKQCFAALGSLNIPEKGNLQKNLNRSLADKRFLWGDKPTVEDEKVFQYLSVKYIMDIASIVSYMNKVNEACAWKETTLGATDTTLKDLNLDDTDRVQCLNELSRRLAKQQSKFLLGEHCTNLDEELYSNLSEGDIRIQPLRGKRQWAPVFTVEQLAVFEGPKKQLIIGGPGSGKTELMRSKALLLSQQTKGEQSTLYLIQLPKKEKTVFPNAMRLYFKQNKAKNIHVKTIDLEGETLEEKRAQRRGQCSQRGVQEYDHILIDDLWIVQEYDHIFIDELWIGSKKRYQMQGDSDESSVIDELRIVKEALEKNVNGYVWMSSVFDYKKHSFEDQKSKEQIEQLLKAQKLQGNQNPLYRTLSTPSLLETLQRNGGVVSRIKHLLRSTNNIVKLLQDYSARYLDRDFTYGTDKMLNHNVEGQDISWIAVQPQRSSDTTSQDREELVRLMYKECAKVVNKALGSTSKLRPPSMKAKNLHLFSGDIMVVNFVARYGTENNLGDELRNQGVQVHELTEKGAVPEDYPRWHCDKVCLLNSHSRFDSTLIDGTEWPMVVILHTSELLLTTLRNYDTFIAMFRAQAKLVVLSDSWRSSKEFLKVIDQKIK